MSYRCTCKNSSYEEHDDYDLYLSGGGHTIVTPMRCCKCHRFTFFPESNWELWLKEGDPDQLKTLVGSFERMAHYYDFWPRVKRFFHNLFSLP